MTTSLLPKQRERWAIHREAPSYEEQTASNEVLETGIKVIDLIWSRTPRAVR